MNPPYPNNEKEDNFTDAVHDFPFYNFTCRNKSEPSASDSSLSDGPQNLNLKTQSDIPSLAPIFRRRSIRRGKTGKEVKDGTLESSTISENELTNDTRKSFRQQGRCVIERDFKENEKGIENPDSAQGQVSSFLAPSGLREQNSEESTITTAANDGPGSDAADSVAEIGDSAQGQVSSFLAPSGLREQNSEESTITTAANDGPGSDAADSVAEIGDSAQGQVSSFLAPSGLREQNSEESTITTAANDGPGSDSADSVAELGDSSFNFLLFVAGLVIRAIGFQINLFISFFTFPIFFLYQSSMFLIDPFQTLRRGKYYLMGNLFQIGDVVGGYISPSLHGWLKQQQSFWKVALRCAWGLLWSFYVCIILFSLLVSSLIISGWLMKYLVEEPLRMKEPLNFDYTKQSPVAYVPLISCAGVGSGEDCSKNIGLGKNVDMRVIPSNHRLQVTVSLLLPESEHNRKLGVFQVRADLLSANGKTLASSSHPCMLQFKSEPIRLFLTFLKIAPLVTGYVSEAQTLNVKMRGFIEGDVPTACLKVTIEQRAEHHLGAGIPEIYDASLVLESKLPFFMRIIWYWKKTIYIWISMMSFMMELLLALVCCRHIIIPRARQGDGSFRISANHNNRPAQS
ncbi:Seipin family [Quillaja saponaria]|uniref:Seipin family n=1 Tax=Quillaja saponaria TaxID=32244 RepID=A0AAD7KWL4_QUISA|nr:Seipin family [Quillaja saponaria]